MKSHRPQFVGTVVVRNHGARMAFDPYSGADVPLVTTDLVEGDVALFSCDDTATASPVEKLASAHSGRAALYKIAAQQGADPVFPDDVMREVAKIADDPRIQSAVDDGEIEDRRHQAFITIDNDDSRDLDQAMFIERIDDGYTVHYALADASHYVTPESALWEEALRRKASLYFPGFAVPMLPPKLSEDLVSLNEQVDRRALVFSMKLNHDAEIQGTDISRCCIRSRRKLAYDGVQNYHDAIRDGSSHDDSKHHGHDFTETILLLREVGEKRIALAEIRDVPRFYRTPIYVSYKDDDGHFFTMVSDARNDVEKWNEQISLLCNMEGAAVLNQFGDDPEVQSVFRNHDAPPHERMRSFAAFVEELVTKQNLNPETFRWRRDESLAVFLARLPTSGIFRRISAVIHQKAIYTNVGAVFEKDATGHYGVGTRHGYARFSSPMREVVGIFTHKELLDGILERPSSAQRDEVLRKKFSKRPTLRKKSRAM